MARTHNLPHLPSLYIYICMFFDSDTPKYFKIIWLWAYMMKVILEGCRVHQHTLVCLPFCRACRTRFYTPSMHVHVLSVLFLIFFIFIIYTYSNYIHVSQIYYNAHHRKIIPLINVNFSSKCSFRKISRFITIFIIIRFMHIFIRFNNSQITTKKYF